MNLHGKRLLILLALAAALVLATSPSLAQQPRAGGTLTVITPADISTMDPHAGYGFSLRVYANVFEPLLRKDEKGIIHGHLVESWKFLDPTHLQMTLRKGIKFHSGTELTADAVKFTYERQLNPANPAVNAQFLRELNLRIRVVDRYTLVLETGATTAVLLDLLAESIVGLIQDPGEVKKWGKDFGLHPSGTGPFKFVEWVRNQYVKLTRNPDYWGGAPYIDTLIFKVIPEEGTRVLALESGEADVLFETPPSAIAGLRANPKLVVSRVPTFRDLNMHLNTSRAPTDDVRLRRALAQAINVKAIVEEVVTPDVGVLSTGLFNPTVFGACDVGFPLYNPEKAKQAFAELGYRPGRDGILAKDGRPLQLSLLLNPQRDPRNPEVAEAIQAQLRSFGVDVKLRLMEFATYAKMLASAEGDYDMAFLGHGITTGDADSKASHFTRANMPPAGLNVPRYSSPELDNVILAARQEMNKEKRKELYCKFGQIYRDQVLGIALYASIRTTTTWRHVNGMVLHPDEWYPQIYPKVWFGPKN